jgi:glyoxylase-like metal-dependent hydrolase (beta-lactamase superfamily II)
MARRSKARLDADAVATPGHTSNHLCFALEESGALFTGDHVMGWSTSVVSPPDGDMADYMASLEKLHGARGPRLLPGPRPGGRQAAPAGARHDRPPPPARAQILRCWARAAPIEAMVPLMYKGVDQRLWPAAGRSVLAHLIDLERRGKVQRDGDRWLLAA